MYFIVLRSVWQAGTTLCAMVTANRREDVINTHTTQKSLEKLAFARVASRLYIRHHYLLPFNYFLLLYTPAFQRGNKKWQLLKFGQIMAKVTFIMVIIVCRWFPSVRVQTAFCILVDTEK